MVLNDKLYDNTFTGTNSDKKLCINPSNIQQNSNEFSITSSCGDQCFTDMKTKKFDVSGNQYVSECDEIKFEYKNLCWENCPYNYSRIYTDRRRCSKEQPGENFYYDSQNNYYKQCYGTCKKCSSGGDDTDHKCDECAEDFQFITDDKYATNSKNCYEKCNKYYYFTENNKHFCSEQCTENFKLISDKNKCIDSCSNDMTIYKLELDNTCVTQCPKGTFQKESNKCEHCYDSCGECTSVGDDSDHKCIECKDNTYSKLLNNDNCYKKCSNYYYFDDHN